MTAPGVLSPSSFVEVLRDDLAAVREAVASNGMQETVIFANRFASDAALFHESEGGQNALFVGGVLRTVADDFVSTSAQLHATNQPVEPLRDLITTFTNVTAEVLPSLNKDFQKFCKAYYELERRLVVIQRSPAEQSAYSETVDLKGVPRRILASELTNRQDELIEPRSLLVGGVVNEFSRLCRVYPFSEVDLCFSTGLRAYLLLDEYYRFLLTLEGNYPPVPRDQVSKDKQETVKRMIEFVSALDSSDSSPAWLRTRDFVSPTIQRWRVFFIQYMQVASSVITRVVQEVGATPSRGPSKTETLRAQRTKKN